MNRKYIIYFLAIAISLLISILAYKYFFSNAPIHQFPESATSTATTTIPQKSIESFSTTTRYYEFSYDVPKDNNIVAQSIKDNAEKWLLETNITKVTDDSQAEREFGIFEGMSYSYDSTYKTIDSISYISYLETIYQFTGGAHGSTNNIAYLFSKKDGVQVKSLKNIYNDNIYNALSEYTRKELPAKLAKKTIIVSEFQDMFDEGTSSTQENWQVFYFKASSLVVVFGQYQIGPYAIGIHELEIPLSVLEKYKK
jgi:Protein of unknown function (DUF3298)/Deacetylase PdaC